MNAVIRAFDAVVDDVDKDERTVVARINARTIDRFNSVIEPGGGLFDAYRRNPIVLWEHGKDPRRFTDPVGRSVWIKHSGGKRPTDIIGKTRFLDDDFSRQRFEWYKDGTLNAFSVRAMPLDFGPPTRDEIREWPELDNGRPNETRGGFDGALMYRKWELAEYSATAVPGNADCLVTERAAKMLDLVSRNLLWLPDDVLPIVEEAARTATESVGGTSGGGGLVEPDDDDEGSTCPECGAKGRAMADGRHECPAGHRYPAPSDRTSTGAPPVVSKSLPLDGRTLEEVWAGISADRSLMKQALREEVMALIDLWIHGKV